MRNKKIEFLEKIRKGSCSINVESLSLVRRAIQKGVFSSEEMMLIRAYMESQGMEDAYNKELLKIRFGSYLKNLYVEVPEEMEKLHAHHILFKCGIGKEQKALVAEGRAILHRNGIDSIVGPENLVWAPNKKGVHTKRNLERLVEALREADRQGEGYEGIKRVLNAFGREAANC